MDEHYDNQPSSGVLRIFCTQCGKPMRVAPEHVSVSVACPYCAQALDPWRAARDAATPSLVQPQLSPAVHGYGSWNARGLSSRNRVTAGLLGIFLGWIGVHRFYLGYHGIGVLQIILTLCTAVAGFWGLIEGILCLTGQHLTHDADGYPLRD